MQVRYHGKVLDVYTEPEITVRHWTSSERLLHLSEQKSICSVKLSEHSTRSQLPAITKVCVYIGAKKVPVPYLYYAYAITASCLQRNCHYTCMYIPYLELYHCHLMCISLKHSNITAMFVNGGVMCNSHRYQMSIQQVLRTSI